MYATHIAGANQQPPGVTSARRRRCSLYRGLYRPWCLRQQNDPPSCRKLRGLNAHLVLTESALPRHFCSSLLFRCTPRSIPRGEQPEGWGKNFDFYHQVLAAVPHHQEDVRGVLTVFTEAIRGTILLIITQSWVYVGLDVLTSPAQVTVIWGDTFRLSPPPPFS